MKQAKTIERKIKWYTSLINKWRNDESLGLGMRADAIKRVRALRRELKWVLR